MSRVYDRIGASARHNMSNFALLADADVEAGLARLRYGRLRSLGELDLGFRILVSELAG